MSDQNCHVDPVEKPIDIEALRQSQAAYLAVWGMGCPTCATRVRNSLLNTDGVLLAEIYLEQRIAAVAFDDAQVSTVALVNAVAAAGNDGRHHYEAKLIRQMPAEKALV
jgi:copper chaperone CopZ